MEKQQYEQFEEERTWSCINEQDERIKKVVGHISDDDYLDAFDAWESYLKIILKFPFDAKVSEYQERGLLNCGDMVVVEKIEACDDPYGIIVIVTFGKKEFYFPLCDLKVINEKSSNFVPIDDYDVWFANR